MRSLDHLLRAAQSRLLDSKPSGAAPCRRSGSRVLLIPRPFVLAGLPHQRDNTLRQVTRTARVGAQSTLRVSYLATHRDHPLPFGADRSLLAWILTRADASGIVRFSAIAEYLEAFRLDQGGRGYEIFWQRFQRISNLALRLEEEKGEQRNVQRLFLVPASTEPGAPAAGHQRQALGSGSIDGYRFRLDQDFWNALEGQRIPAPLSLLRAFHRRPLAWDFAQLLLYRSFIARNSSRIPWDAICHQLGSRDRSPRRLRQKLKKVLAEISQRYPDCPARFLRGKAGLQIEPWRPLRLGGGTRVL